MLNIPLLMSSPRSFDSIISWPGNRLLGQVDTSTDCWPLHSVYWSIGQLVIFQPGRLAKRFMAQSTVDKARFRMRPAGQNIANFMQNANAFRTTPLTSDGWQMDGNASEVSDGSVGGGWGSCGQGEVLYDGGKSGDFALGLGSESLNRD